MSDIVDMTADSVEAITGAGGSFAHSPAYVAPRAAALPACSCGGRPAYAPHPAFKRGGDLLEVLKCGSCGNFVGPFSCRAALATAWRLGGNVAR